MDVHATLPPTIHIFLYHIIQLVQTYTPRMVEAKERAAAPVSNIQEGTCNNTSNSINFHIKVPCPCMQHAVREVGIFAPPSLPNQGEHCTMQFEYKDMKFIKLIGR